MTATPIQIGIESQLFIDDRFVNQIEDLTRVVNPPVKAGPVDIAPQPTGMVSIVEHQGTFYMYGRCNEEAGEIGMNVALSTDGLRWRPADRTSFGPGRNVAVPGVDSGGVCLDPTDPEYPFKGLFDIRREEYWPVESGTAGDVLPTGHTQACARGGLYLFRSVDGLQWELVPGLPVPSLCDTQNQLIYDPRLRRFVAYLRAFPMLGGPHNEKRCVVRTEIEDLSHFPWPSRANPENKPSGHHQYPYIHDEMPIVLADDCADPPGTDLYNPAMELYEGVYLAFPSMYRCYGYSGENVSLGRDMRGNWSNGGLFETHIAVSRDGLRFTRYRTPYLASGLIDDHLGFSGDPDCGLIMMGVGMLQRGDEIWQYYYGTQRVHGMTKEFEGHRSNQHGVFRAVQRRDGFVSMDAGHSGGELTTPVLQFAGDRLTLNAACHGLGEVWVEIQDPEGRPLPGFGMDDAVSIDRNGIRQEIWWRQGPDLQVLAGCPVRLRIRLRSAKLYAFRFTRSVEGEPT